MGGEPKSLSPNGFNTLDIQLSKVNVFYSNKHYVYMSICLYVHHTISCLFMVPKFFKIPRSEVY